MPEVLAAMRQKITARLAEVTARPDSDRLEKELVYLGIPEKNNQPGSLI